MRPEQLDLLTSVSAPSVQPGSGTIAFSTSTPSFATDSYRGQVFSVNARNSGSPDKSDSVPRRWTRGESDQNPVFSPDGRMLAFTRAVDGVPQIFIAPTAGGEPWQVTERKLGVSDYVFAPDSGSLVFVSREPEAGRYGTIDGVDSTKEDPRIITANKYQANGVGYVKDRPKQVFLVEVTPEGPEPQPTPVGRAAEDKTTNDVAGADDKPANVPAAHALHPSSLDQTDPRFSADGSAVYFVTTVGTDADDTLESTIVRVSASGGGLETVTNRDGTITANSSPWPSQDGRRLYFVRISIGAGGRDIVARNPTLVVRDLESGRETELTDPKSDYVSAILDESTDGGLLFTTWERGEHVLRYAAVTPSTGNYRVSAITSLEISVQGAAFIGPDRVALSYRSSSTNGDIGIVPLTEAPSATTVLPLTDLSGPLRSTSAVVEPLTVEATGPDGYPIHGWVLTPRGEGPHPVLLNIHGGPFHAYDSTYFDEAQVYVEAGYAVVMCNPRGSASYGRGHGLAVKNGFGTVDAQDVLAFLDHALTLPGLDANRVGIMGGSYGGYLTAWIISHTDRFVASVVERGFLEPLSFQGTSDIGWLFGDEYLGVSVEDIARQSPMEHIGKVTTPTMVVHSELDLRCPLEQGQRYYTQLKRQGVPSELVVFPGENHELTRSGTPWHRRRRFEIVLDWFARHLPVR